MNIYVLKAYYYVYKMFCKIHYMGVFAKSRQKNPLGQFFESLPFHIIFCLLGCQHNMLTPQQAYYVGIKLPAHSTKIVKFRQLFDTVVISVANETTLTVN